MQEKILLFSRVEVKNCRFVKHAVSFQTVMANIVILQRCRRRRQCEGKTRLLSALTDNRRTANETVLSRPAKPGILKIRTRNSGHFGGD